MMGPTGTRTITRISAFLLLCIGVQILITGIEDVLGPLTIIRNRRCTRAVAGRTHLAAIMPIADRSILAVGEIGPPKQGLVDIITHYSVGTISTGAHVARAALSYLWNQGENGICCPMGMSFASIPALRHDPALLDEWSPHILKAAYDDRPIYAKEKAGVTVGMAMTEKQAGSDLRATITTGRPATARRDSGAPYLLTGHKWFFSVPMSDIFLTLAQTEKGLSCFVATGWLPDGSRNRLKIQRLKDKCGNKSNASSEIEFYDLYAKSGGTLPPLIA